MVNLGLEEKVMSIQPDDTINTPKAQSLRPFYIKLHSHKEQKGLRSLLLIDNHCTATNSLCVKYPRTTSREAHNKRDYHPQIT